FDVDSLDSELSMGTGTPVPNGLTLEDGKKVFSRCFQEDKVKVFEVTEINPLLDVKNKMAKNIVICADGTGNLGGETPDSNVYKMYNAIDIHSKKQRQVTFYDNGVGTASNKYWRAVSGAFGFGFKRNVCDLYRFLAKHYDQGDQVFMFGFSRGAAEVRAFSGFIAAVGLIDGRTLTEEALRQRVEEAYAVYKSQKPNLNFGEHGVIPITCIGVWDTVSALGFPQDWRITGIGLWLLNAMFMVLDRLFDVIFPHRFYNYKLTPNVKFAYQALAIDDERQSFTPLVWDELNCGQDTHVEQVWFVGSHSNVGGGYGRAGLANVSLEWMISRVLQHNLFLKNGVYDIVRLNANEHGRLYDSRDGVAVYYRYAPRDIQALCRDKVRGPIHVHRSVIARMEEQTANYSPSNLPDQFDVVGSDSVVTITSSGTVEEKKAIRKWVLCREWLYGLFLEFTLLVVGSAICLWIFGVAAKDMPVRQGFLGLLDSILGHIAEVLLYILPMMFKGLITVAVIQKPIIFGVALAFLIALWWAKGYFRYHCDLACEMARDTLLKSLPSKLKKDDL
ncbi:MAG: phospholipase effector Tle1 domain-containing protein, partial [Nitrospirales bacterium]